MTARAGGYQELPSGIRIEFRLRRRSNRKHFKALVFCACDLGCGFCDNDECAHIDRDDTKAGLA